MILVLPWSLLQISPLLFFDKLVDATTIIGAAFRKRLLIPNYAAGKSSLAIQTSGELSRALKKFLLLAMNSQIPIREYKHLGALAASNASLTLEIRNRAARHTAAYAPLRKALMRRSLPVKSKLIYVDAFATGLLHTHAGAWENLNGPQAATLDALQMDSYRAATGQNWDPATVKHSNNQILNK